MRSKLLAGTEIDIETDNEVVLPKLNKPQPEEKKMEKVEEEKDFELDFNTLKALENDQPINNTDRPRE